MRRKNAYIGVLIVVCILFAINMFILENLCEVEESNRANREIANKVLVNTKSLDNVSMKIKEGTLTRKGATITIYDGNIEHFAYHDKFRIECFENGEWKELPFISNRDFGEYGVTPRKESYIEMQQNWEYYFGELKNGKYRLRKSVKEEGFCSGKEQFFFVEFTIDF